MKENQEILNPIQKDETAQNVLRSSNRHLVLYNDDVNSFDYVISCLVEVCEHDFIQAEQCAFITHFKGKCDIKKGDYKSLKPMKQNLVDKGLRVTID
jgi:ATP-dependent Clp protease adaptor protein ClpS